MTRSQDGNKHYLLCADCEQYLGEAESYLAALSRGGAGDLALIGVEMFVGPVLSGVKVQLVYRALFGLLLKAHYSPSPPYHRVGVRRRSLKKLRQAMLNDTYSAVNAHVVATRWMSCFEPGINPRAAIFASVHKPEGFAVFAATLGGTEWMLFFDQLPAGAKQFKPVFMRCDVMPVLLGDVTQHRNFETLRDAIGAATDNPMPWRQYPRDEHCPCGLDASRSFGDCCADTWCFAAEVNPDFGDMLSD